jgi:hypothetical protein
LKIIHQYQPLHSSLCGQACVAMILGCSLARAVEMLGKGCTTGPQLSKVLYDYKVHASPSQIRLSKARRIYRNQKYSQYVPEKCIAKVRSAGVKKSHWVLFWDRKEYDPYPVRVPWQYISGYIEIY